MWGYVYSGVLRGIDGCLVRVEADAGPGLPYFEMVGFLASEVREAKERVRAALRNAGIRLPAMRITVNLSPANVRKSGNYFDLPVAAAVLSSLGFCSQERLNGVMMAGELGLDGGVRPVAGILPLVWAARNAGVCRCVVPEANAAEAGLLEGIRVTGVRSLKELLSMLEGGWPALPEDAEKAIVQTEERRPESPDFSDVNGNRSCRNAQYFVHRAPGRREIHDSQEDSRNTSGAFQRGEPGDYKNLQRSRSSFRKKPFDEQQAVPGPPLFTDKTGNDRRRQDSEAGRNFPGPQGRAFSG